MFLKKRRKNKGFNAIGVHPDGISFVRVSRENPEKPSVEAWEFLPCNDIEQEVTLKELSKRYHLDKCQCGFSLGDGEYRLLLTEKPNVPEEELSSALQWEIKDLIDFPVDQSTISTFPVPEIAEVTHQNINVVAAKRQVIKDKVELFKKGNIPVRTIDIEELVVRNLGAVLEADGKGIAILLLHENHGLILFMKDGEMFFSRHIDIGAQRLATSDTALEGIALEIQRSIDYFDRHFSSVVIGGLNVLPFAGKENDVVDFLNNNLSMSCSLANLNQNIEWKKEVNDADKIKALLTLGLALRNEAA